MSAGNDAADRRRAPRHQAQHEARLLFVASLPASAAHPPREALLGQTQDISSQGLSLITEPADQADYDLYDRGCQLSIKLSLPSGVVEMEGEVARREWVSTAGRREHLLLGVSITGMSAADEARYEDYLNALTS